VKCSEALPELRAHGKKQILRKANAEERDQLKHWTL